MIHFLPFLLSSFPILFAFSLPPFTSAKPPRKPQSDKGTEKQVAQARGGLGPAAMRRFIILRLAKETSSMTAQLGTVAKNQMK